MSFSTCFWDRTPKKTPASNEADWSKLSALEWGRKKEKENSCSFKKKQKSTVQTTREEKQNTDAEPVRHRQLCARVSVWRFNWKLDAICVSASFPESHAHLSEINGALCVPCTDFWSRPEDTSSSFPAGPQTRSIESEQRRSARQCYF